MDGILSGTAGIYEHIQSTGWDRDRVRLGSQLQTSCEIGIHTRGRIVKDVVVFLLPLDLSHLLPVPQRPFPFFRVRVQLTPPLKSTPARRWECDLTTKTRHSSDRMLLNPAFRLWKG